MLCNERAGASTYRNWHTSGLSWTYRSGQGSAETGTTSALRSVWSNVDLWSGKVLKVLNQIVKWVRQESAAFQALVLAFIALGIAFQWWTWSNAQTGAVVGIVAALLGMFVRSQVTPLVRPMDGGRPLIRGPSE